MSTKKNQKEKVIWSITIALLAFFVIILIGFYYNNHPNKNINSDEVEQTVDNTIEDSKEILLEQVERFKSAHEKSIQKLDAEIQKLKAEFEKATEYGKKDLQDQIAKLEDHREKLQEAWQKLESATAQTFNELKEEYDQLKRRMLSHEKSKT